VRAAGRWDLTAIGVNQVIGGAIFLVPSQVAAQVGNWGPVAFALVGVASMLVALCFAEVSSRFEKTGGAYLYSRAAFGRFVGFEVGWINWFVRVTSQASIVNGLALALGFYWPAFASPVGRALVITVMTCTLAAINVRGIRQSVWVVNTLTIAKLVPLVLLIGVGLFTTELSRLGPMPEVTWAQASAAALLLTFTFGGYDVVTVPAGESRDPRRHAPFSLVATIVIVTVVMTLVQVVTAAALPNLAGSKTPVADASLVILGAAGALIVGLGSVVSIAGNNAGQVLSGSRMLYALAEQGDLPAALARIHSRYHTPAVAVLVTSGIALVLALSGSFAALAIVSAVGRLVSYVGTCAATLTLRHPRYRDKVLPAAFVLPLGPVVPVLAILASMVILFGASRAQLLAGLAVLALGAVVYWANLLLPPPSAGARA
jgi:amino acid transporter